jgi:hypothetical protein
MKIIKLVPVVALLFICCTKLCAQADNTAVAVQKALDGQVAAWNAGDLEKAMAFYWNSPELLWINKAGIQKGYQPVLDDFRKSYTDKSTMGTYSYEPLHIETLSANSAYFVFKWKIELNGKRLMGGISSQVWKYSTSAG